MGFSLLAWPEGLVFGALFDSMFQDRDAKPADVEALPAPPSVDGIWLKGMQDHGDAPAANGGLVAAETAPRSKKQKKKRATATGAFA